MRGNLSAVTVRLLRYDAPNALRSEVPPSEFPGQSDGALLLSAGGYFLSGDADKDIDNEVCSMNMLRLCVHVCMFRLKVRVCMLGLACV